MRWYCIAAWLSALVLAASPVYPEEPARFIPEGQVTGGKSTEGTVLSGIRFGNHSGFTRMVLDLDQADGQPAAIHPVYRVSYMKYPYRLIVNLEGVKFNVDAKVQSKPALPFSVITELDGTIREMQIFLPGPFEFKVIEIDDPAKISIDVRLTDAQVPRVFTVQLTEPENAEEAFTLIRDSSFPPGFNPSVLVLGENVVVEQVFSDTASAVAMDEALREMGFETMINERRGDQLPQI